MKKSIIITFCYTFLALYIISCFIFTHPLSASVEASTVSQTSNLKNLKATSADISKQLTELQTHLTAYDQSLNEFEKRLSEVEAQNTELQTFLVDYYIEKLKDPTYTSITNEDSIYYTAAENLGLIGKPAIPKLIQKLDTANDYERALTLYALLLASQADNVKAFAKNDYINVNLDFDARNHPQKVEIARKWWNKYKSYFD